MAARCRRAIRGTGRVSPYRVTNIMRAPGLPTPVGLGRRAGDAQWPRRRQISIPFGYAHLGLRLAEGLVTSDGVLWLLDGTASPSPAPAARSVFGLRAPEWLAKPRRPVRRWRPAI